MTVWWAYNWYYLYHTHRQHKKQLVTMDTLQRELEDTQQRYSKDKKQFIKIRLQTKVKERLHQDLGGLSDTVVGVYSRIGEGSIIG